VENSMRGLSSAPKFLKMMWVSELECSQDHSQNAASRSRPSSIWSTGIPL